MKKQTKKRKFYPMGKRRKFDTEFKKEAVELALSRGRLLRKENAELKVENAILKKVTAIFSKGKK